MIYILEFTEENNLFCGSHWDFQHTEQKLYFDSIEKIKESVNLKDLTVIKDKVYKMESDYPITIKDENNDVVSELKLMWT